MRQVTASLFLVGALGLGGCGGTWSAPPGQVLEGNGVSRAGGATVVTAEELHSYNGSVLLAIKGKVPNMKISFMGLDRCPAIALRTHEDIHGRNFPLVYLDGTRTSSTCILESIPAHDLDRVEVYPMGFTTRPGYSTHSQGLILLFSRTAGE